MKALMHAVSKNHNSRFIRTLAFTARGGIATGEKVITLLDNHLTERGKLRVKSFMTEVRKEMSLNTPARSRADLFVKWGFGLAKGVVKGIGRAARLPRGSVRPSA